MGSLVDTGLGWYADEDWLADAPGSIGSYSKGSEIEPLPIFGKILTVVVGTTVGYAKNSSNTNCSFIVTSPSSAVYCSMLISGSAIQMILSSQQPFNVTGYEGGTQTFSTAAATPFLGTDSYGVTWTLISNYTSTWGASSRFDTADGDTALSVVNEQRAPKVYLAEVGQSYSILLVGNRWRDFSVSRASKPVYFCVAYYEESGSWYCELTASSEASFSATYAGNTMSVANPTPYGYNEYGFTYYHSGVSGSSYYINSAIHAYGSKTAGAYNVHQAVIGAGGRVTVNYAKSSAGYSVTCLCKWRTDYQGDVYFSPVLISSQSNNTQYTRNSAVPSVNNTEHQYRGMTFYMRKAPLDTLTGEEEITASYPVVDLSGVAQTNDTIFAAIAYQSSLGVGYIPGDEDPYAGGGTSGPGGGTDTDFDITGDTILDSPLPTFSFANSGFARIYNPNLSQLQSLANYLWTDTNFLQTIVNHAKQLLEDPIESIITLNRLPISVPNGTAEVVKVLYIPTNTSMPPVTNQFVDVNCGTLQIKHEYDSALDYNPYTDISLVLPFIGVVQLDSDEVMDKTLSLTYRVDVVSGMCVAKVAVDDCVLYQYSGNCAISMPFNSADFSNYISAMVTAAKSIAGVAAAGAAGAMAAAAEGTGAVKAAVSGAVSGGPESTGPSLSNSSNSTNMFKETFGKGGIGEGTLKASKKGIANTVSAVVSSKRTIEHAGHFSGNSGFLGVRRPYAIIKRPRMCNPDEYGRFNGRPCMMYLYLGNLSGYTEVQEIQLTGIVATNDELVEIENFLKSGVIL